MDLQSYTLSGPIKDVEFVDLIELNVIQHHQPPTPFYPRSFGKRQTNQSIIIIDTFREESWCVLDDNIVFLRRLLFVWLLNRSRRQQQQQHHHRRRQVQSNSTYIRTKFIPTFRISSYIFLSSFDVVYTATTFTTTSNDQRLLPDTPRLS
jgi:hypothetical protein